MESVSIKKSLLTKYFIVYTRDLDARVQLFMK